MRERTPLLWQHPQHSVPPTLVSSTPNLRASRKISTPPLPGPQRVPPKGAERQPRPRPSSGTRSFPEPRGSPQTLCPPFPKGGARASGAPAGAPPPAAERVASLPVSLTSGLSFLRPGARAVEELSCVLNSSEPWWVWPWRPLPRARRPRPSSAVPRRLLPYLYPSAAGSLCLSPGPPHVAQAAACGLRQAHRGGIGLKASTLLWLGLSTAPEPRGSELTPSEEISSAPGGSARRASPSLSGRGLERPEGEDGSEAAASPRPPGGRCRASGLPPLPALSLV